MQQQEFIDRLLQEATAAGIAPAEAYYTGSNSFSAKCQDGLVDDYNVSAKRALGFRGIWHGHMGYASTTAFDEEAVSQLISGVQESAEVIDSPDEVEIYAGDDTYPEYEEPESDLSRISAADKLSTCLEMEKAVLKADSRISRAQDCTVTTAEGEVILQNTYGLSLRRTDQVWMAYCGAIAPRGESVVTGGEYVCGRRFSELDIPTLAQAAAEDTVRQLDAVSVPSGEYRTILHRDAMRQILSTFAGVFSAESAQKNMSLLSGKEGQKIAADCVTLIDDPLLPGGFSSAPFDAEGCATRTKSVIADGILMTLLHNRKTAKKQGIATTGNAGRGSYSAPVNVTYYNFYIKPGEADLNSLCRRLGDGLVITEVSGLHAGANPLSGDFSLLSKGYRVRNGEKAESVEQITVAGNFYKLLMNIQAVGNDLTFRGSGIGCPSVDVGTLVVSGQ